MQSLWDKYYQESHGVIFIVDSSEPERFDEAKEAFDKMIQNRALEGVPLLVIANKQDLDVSSVVLTYPALLPHNNPFFSK